MSLTEADQLKYKWWEAEKSSKMTVFRQSEAVRDVLGAPALEAFITELQRGGGELSPPRRCGRGLCKSTSCFLCSGAGKQQVGSHGLPTGLGSCGEPWSLGTGGVLPDHSLGSFGFWSMSDVLSFRSGGLVEGKILQPSSLGFSPSPDIWSICLTLLCLWSLTLAPLTKDVFDASDLPSCNPPIAHY